jgi:hypothetical protein
LSGGQFIQGFQQPYNSFSFGYPLQIGQGFTLPSGNYNYGYPGQFSQQGMQFSPVLQQFFPMSNYNIFSPFTGKFSNSFLGAFNFLAFR